MSSEGSRLWLTLACALVLLGGCASVPPAPANAQNPAKTGEDEYEGWLFKSLTGQKTAATTPQAAPQRGRCRRRAAGFGRACARARPDR